MHLYISPSGIPHVTIEPNGKRHQLWPLLEKLQALAAKAPKPVVAGQITTIVMPAITNEALLENTRILAADYAADEGKVSVNESVTERTISLPTSPTDAERMFLVDRAKLPTYGGSQ